MKFSVLMSCYKNDNPSFLKEAIDSCLLKQSLKPDEFILMIDGLISDELYEVIRYYQKNFYSFKAFQIPINKGLGNALREGLLKCSSDYIVRMDSDDISHPDRFKYLTNIATLHPEYSVIGSHTAEFFDNINRPNSIRVLKEFPEQIYKDAKKRSPVSHVSVMLKKKDVLDAGNYQDFLLYEDYYLWIRMLNKNFKFYNIQKILVYVRTDVNRYERKGNSTYVKSSVNFQYYLLKINFINRLEFLRNLFGRLFVAYMPVKFRKKFYEKILRKGVKNFEGQIHEGSF